MSASTIEPHLEPGLLFQFLDGDLLDAECVEVEQHLTACPDCRASYRDLLRREDHITELLFGAALEKAPPGRQPPVGAKAGGSYPMMPVIVATPDPARLRAPRRHRLPLLLIGTAVMLSLWGFLLWDWFAGSRSDPTFEELLLTQRRLVAPVAVKHVTNDGEEVAVDYEFAIFVRVALIRSGQVAVYHRAADGQVELVIPGSGEPLPALEASAAHVLPAVGPGIVPEGLGARGTVIVIPFRLAPSRQTLVDLAAWLTASSQEKEDHGWQEPLRRRFPSARFLPYRVEDLESI